MFNPKKSYGFRTRERLSAPEINAEAYILEHEKTGAKVLILDRADDNMTFSIGFKTPPTDSTGVFHILEHSVLCGSERFPSKEPFTELLKSSLKTFLNAFTYSDRTVYPVSSRNKKDFLNLVNVYLDAVFFPKATRDESIFLQEGHRTELDKECRPVYNGVVYNEMKGAYSSPEEAAQQFVDELLYPTGSYHHDSGGKPEEILKLTYSDFCSAHEKYYHPSNSYTVLDGSVDADALLSLLDEYFSRFEKRSDNIEIDVDCLPSSEVRVVEYESETETKCKLYYAFRGAKCAESDKGLALSVAQDLLAAHNGAPLRRVILESGMCESFTLSYVDGAKEGALLFEYKGVSPDCEAKLIDLTRETLGGLIAEGFDRELIDASFNTLEFRARERDFGSYPKGIVFATAAYDGWIYGLDPLTYILPERIFDSLRPRLYSGYIEEVLSSVVSGTPATLVMKPVPSLKKKDNATPMTKDELALVRKKLKLFEKRQSTPDKASDLRKIPRLSLSDIGEAPPPVPRNLSKIGETTLLHYPLDTSGILYFDLYFDISDTLPKDAYRAFVYTCTLADLKNASGDAAVLKKRIKTELGSLSLSTVALKKGEETRLYLAVTASVLSCKAKSLPPILGEYLLTTDFSDTEPIKRKLNQLRIVFEGALAERGNHYALSRAKAMLDPLSALNEYISGYESIKRIRRDSEDEDAPAAMAEFFKRLSDSAFTRDRLLISYAGECRPEIIREIVELFPKGNGEPSPMSVPLLKKQNELLITPAEIGYATVSAPLPPSDLTELGSFAVLGNILGYELLWNEIRLRGGAYDTGFIHKHGSRLVGMYSFRDPSPQSSVVAFLNTPKLIRSFATEEDDLSDFIISCVGENDMISTPRQDASLSTLYYLMGRTDEENLKIRQKMLEFDKPELLRLADKLETALKDCVKVLVCSSEYAKTVPNPTEWTVIHDN